MLSLPRVIGHRGAAAAAPENTLSSFRRAAQLGARWVELDVQLSADGHPVVFHDDCLDRTSSGHGPVSAYALADLLALDAGGWFGPAFSGERIPRLEQALVCIAGLGLGVNIEIKAEDDRGRDTAQAALTAALAVWPDEAPPPLLSSFSRTALAEALRIAPQWPRGLLAESLPQDWRKACSELNCIALNLDEKALTPAQVAEVKQAGLDVLAWTVNSPERAECLWSWGVASVFSDQPDFGNRL